MSDTKNKSDVWELPENHEAEARVLGAILLDPKATLEAFKILQPSDFTKREYRHIFEAACRVGIEGTEVDTITVSERLRSMGVLDEVGGIQALTQLHNATATSAQLRHHCRILRDMRQRRMLVRISKQMATSKASSASELLADVDSKLGSVREQIKRFSDEPPQVVTAAQARDYLGEIKWLWPGWLPFGMLSMVVGIGGIGKSAFALALSKIVMSQASRWPDDQPFAANGRPPKIVWLDTEGTHPILTDRIKRWGMNENDVIWPADPARPDDLFPEFKILNTTHWDRFARLVEHVKPVAIVIDSLRGAFTGDENSSDACQANLDPLAALARNAGCVIILVHHLNKGEVLGHIGDKLDPSRIRGNTTIFNMMRSIIGLDTPNPDHRDHMRGYVMKSNVIAIPDTEIGFRFSEAGPVWCEPPEPPERPLSATDRAKEFLEAQLQSEPQLVDEIRAAAQADGISWRSIERAKRELNIVKVREEARGPYRWSLPARPIDEDNGGGEEWLNE